MRQQIQPPKNWQDFEELCLRLWRDMWGDPNAHKNGRGGQSQDGVDVYGIGSYDGNLHGVQCKGKNANYGAALTEDEIKKEANNAEGFTPALSSFVMATTSPRDVNLQKYCRELNDKKAHAFTVDVWSWDDIEEELQYRPEIPEKLHMAFDNSEQKSPSIKISRVTGNDRLLAFMTRPIVKAATSSSMRMLLHNVFYELMQNAFIHGHASQCMLAFKDNTFVVVDDGLQFDQTTLCNGNGRGGALTLKHLFDVCGDEVNLDYHYANDNGESENILSLNISSVMLCKDIYSIKEFFVDQGFRVQSREEAKGLALANIASLGEDEFASVIFGELAPISGIWSYVGTAVRMLGSDRISVSLPRSKENMVEQLKKLIPNVIVR